MAYKLKITGLTGFKQTLKESRQEIKASIQELNNRSISFNVGGIVVNAEFKDQKVTSFLEKLPSLINKAHKNALNQLTELLRDALNTAMESSVWDWGSDSRDIIDTGALRDSLKLYVDSDGDIHVLYGEDYAAIVHYGGYFHPFGNENVIQYYPGRPWVDSVLNGGGPVPQFDFASNYINLFTLELERLIG
jgi:DNA-binding protein YbaB